MITKVSQDAGIEPLTRQVCKPGGIRTSLRAKFQKESVGSTLNRLLGHDMPKISNSTRMAFEALDAYVADKKNQVDPNWIHAMGLSMGGYGTWDAIREKTRFLCRRGSHLWWRG